MKKLKITTLSVLISILLCSNVFATDSIKVSVNGSQLSLTTHPVTEGGRTLVPLRAIFESLGAKVEWDSTTNMITGIQKDKTIMLTINSKTASINGENIELDVPAMIVNGNTLVPVRFIAESLGAEVGWENNTVIVTTKDADTINSIKPMPQNTHRVVRVVDGDTIIVNYNGKDERVRLIGVDTPESVHPDASKNIEEGKVASDFTKDNLEGKDVRLEFDVQERDHYGRLLAYVWLDSTMFNKTLLQEGYAQIATYPPNVRYVEEFTKIQTNARTSNKGLWNGSDFNGESIPIVKTSGKYVGSLQSDKYHYPTCRHAKNITAINETWFDIAEEAKAQGYSPCGICKP